MCGEPQSALRNLHAAASYQTVHLRVILLWCSGEESGGLFKAKTRTVASRSINMGSKFKEQTSGKNITNKQMLPYGGMRWFDEHDSDKNGICFTESRSHLTGTPIGLGPTFGDHPSINQSTIIKTLKSFWKNGVIPLIKEQPFTGVVLPNTLLSFDVSLFIHCG